MSGIEESIANIKEDHIPGVLPNDVETLQVKNSLDDSYIKAWGLIDAERCMMSYEDLLREEVWIEKSIRERIEVQLCSSFIDLCWH